MRTQIKGRNVTVTDALQDYAEEKILRVHKLMQENPDRDSHIVLPVHDEIITEVGPTGWTRQWVSKLKSTIEDNGGLFKKVKTKCEVSRVTSSWLAKKEITL